MPLTTAQRETYETLAPDITPMIHDHWRELALFQDDIPLDPDWGAYRGAMHAGVVRAYAVRFGGALIGYAIFQVIERHAHYLHRFAINDILWIAPDHRNFGIGSLLCETFERDLREGGPIVIVIETKAHSPALAALCQARGYDLIGPVFGKRFG